MKYSENEFHIFGTVLTCERRAQEALVRAKSASISLSRASLKAAPSVKLTFQIIEHKDQWRKWIHMNSSCHKINIQNYQISTLKQCALPE